MVGRALTDVSRRFWELVDEGMLDDKINVSTRALTSSEAIGNPERRDFPLLRGKEVLMQAEFRGCHGQAFTTMPCAFEGTLGDVKALPLESNFERAVLIASINAVLRSMGRIEGTVHCRDDGPELCGARTSREIEERLEGKRLGIVGFQPALVDHCVRCLGCERVRVSDLGSEVGVRRYGIEVMDGATHTDELVEGSDMLLITGTTLVNDTLDKVLERAIACNVDVLFYGTTAAGPAHLCGWERLCPESR
ncbi:MAG: Rossmann-like domain-containing protein [Methermicoccaceae archaeon]